MDRKSVCTFCKDCSKLRVNEYRKKPEFRKMQQMWNDKWRINNKEKVLFIRRKSESKRRSLIKNNGDFTLEEWNKKKQEYNNCCACCKVSSDISKLTVDHIVPVSIGGSNDISNIQPLCRSCNSKKFNKIIKF